MSLSPELLLSVRLRSMADCGRGWLSAEALRLEPLLSDCCTWREAEGKAGSLMLCLAGWSLLLRREALPAGCCAALQLLRWALGPAAASLVTPGLSGVGLSKEKEASSSSSSIVPRLLVAEVPSCCAASGPVQVLTYNSTFDEYDTIVKRSAP